MPRSIIALIGIILVLCVVVAWRFIECATSSLHLSFADEQTQIFDEMAAKAAESLRQSPPDVRAAIGYLEYMHNYYPSGTKQTTGSRLDRIVERSRWLAELRIIQLLQEATGKNLGNDADAWIREFSDATKRGRDPFSDDALSAGNAVDRKRLPTPSRISGLFLDGRITATDTELMVFSILRRVPN